MLARLTLLLILLLAGCTTTYEPPDLGGLYTRSARYHGADRNPVIVIPGILGSRLIDDESGLVVWGAFAGKWADPNTPEGARLVGMPMREGVPLNELHDGVRPDGALDRLKISVLGLPIQLNAYAELLVSLGGGGYRDQGLAKAGAIDYGTDHFTCFQFAYDWRRDNIENARLLHEFILDKRKYVHQKFRERGIDKPEDEIRFDIVAHSMGGLVTRYFLRYGSSEPPPAGAVPPWTGAPLVDRAILVGTPNAGSAHAMVELVEGVDFAPVVPKYEAGVLGTMPAIYQLASRARHMPSAERFDPFDPEVWIANGWGLADPAQDKVLAMLLPQVADKEARRRVALDHLRKCLARARRFQEALDVPAQPPAGTELFLFTGDALPTAANLAIRDGRLAVTHFAPGDGTVLRSSALMDERLGGSWSPGLRSPIYWSHATFLFRDHLGLTKDPMFTDNLLYLLLEDPRP